MLVTNYDTEIQNEIIKFHDKSFPFPDVSDKTYIEKRVVIDNGSIVGCGLIRLTTEFTLILNTTESTRVRVNAIDLLQRDLVCKLLKRGIRDTHIFVNDDKVSRIAQRMGFEKCPEKEALSLRFGY